MKEPLEKPVKEKNLENACEKAVLSEDDASKVSGGATTGATAVIAERQRPRPRPPVPYKP